MRVTDEITSKMAIKSGLPIYRSSMDQNSKNPLLEALNNKSWEDKYDRFTTSDSKKAKALIKAADKMMDIGNIFDTSGKETKLYEDARENNDLSEIVYKMKDFSSGYNDLLRSLEESNNGLFQLYKTELKNAATEQKGEFLSLGITIDKDGSMSVDDDKLKAADLDEFKKNMDLFSHKVLFLADRVRENANAAEESISGRYDAFGKILSSGTNRFDLWG